MYFYLKKPKGEVATAIDLIFYAKDEPTSNKNFKYSTKQKINPIEWDFSTRYPKVKRGAIGKKNKQIALILDNYKKLLQHTISEYQQKNIPLTKSALRSVFDKEFKYNYKSDELPYVVSEAIKVFMESKKKRKDTSKAWDYFYNNMSKKIALFDHYRNKVTLFGDLNENWIDTYCGFLRDFINLVDKQKAKELGAQIQSNNTYNDNTLHRHIKVFLAFLNWVRDNYGFTIKELKNTVKKYDIDAVHLTDVEIQKIEKVKLTTEEHNQIRDIFLLGIYTGQRFSDYSVFNKSDVVKTPNGDMIIKRNQKTVHESFVPLTPRLSTILDKYNWNIPVISKNRFNTEIKKICKEAGITTTVKKLTKIGNKKHTAELEKWQMIGTHTARRTFITLSSEKGMPDHIIMKITGIRKADTLTKYKKTNQESVINFMQQTWG